MAYGREAGIRTPITWSRDAADDVGRFGLSRFCSGNRADRWAVSDRRRPFRAQSVKFLSRVATLAKTAQAFRHLAGSNAEGSRWNEGNDRGSEAPQQRSPRLDRGLTELYISDC